MCGWRGRQSACCSGPDDECLTGCCDGAICVTRAGRRDLICAPFDREAPLDAALAGIQGLPEGFALPPPVDRDLQEIAATYRDPAATEALYASLGWEGNAAATATDATGTSIYLSVHRFGSTPEARVAFDHAVEDSVRPAEGRDAVANALLPGDLAHCGSTPPSDREGTWVMVLEGGLDSEAASAATLLAQRGPYLALVRESPWGDMAGCGLLRAPAALVVEVFARLGLLSDE